MLDWLVIIFIIMALVFMLLTFEKIYARDYFWAFIFSFICIFLWYFLAASILEVEIPYEIYNATSGQIETGSHMYTSKVAPELVLFFQMMASIMFIFNVFIVFIGLSDYLKRRRMIR